MQVAQMRGGALGAVVIALALISACTSKETPAAGGTTSASSGGGTALRPFHGDRQLAIQGRQLFINYNCYGCHGGLAGGAMGPSLRDTTWKYGGTDSAIVSSMRDGRPAGMPSWGGTIPDTGFTKLLTYIRSLRTSAEPTFFFSPTDTTTHADLGVAASP
jgi:mono/diheme cytochrome c family protein